MTSQITVWHELDTKMGKVTLLNGYWFYFTDGDNKFAVHGSGYSGKETIYVNDKVVSEKRNYRVKSEHNFSVGKDRYEVKFNMISILRGELVCQLFKNNVLIAEETKAYHSDSTKMTLVKLVGFFLLGVIGGGIAATLVHNFVS